MNIYKQNLYESKTENAVVIFPKRPKVGELCFPFKPRMHIRGELLEPWCAHVINKDLIPSIKPSVPFHGGCDAGSWRNVAVNSYFKRCWLEWGNLCPCLKIRHDTKWRGFSKLLTKTGAENWQLERGLSDLSSNLCTGTRYILRELEVKPVKGSGKFMHAGGRVIWIQRRSRFFLQRPELSHSNEAALCPLGLLKHTSDTMGLTAEA